MDNHQKNLSDFEDFIRRHRNVNTTMIYTHVARKSYSDISSCGAPRIGEKSLDVWPALMGDLLSNSEIRYLKKILAEHQIKSDLEIESLEGYPFVLENMKRRGVQGRLPS